ncbi:N-acyl-D-amino-acid deacylase family protein [Sphingomonas crocodyli]|uniref:Amidohydrolase n=1 Tax=Sphingomonas crocodyli TaxID=1979270 RepID=A0A437LZZ8_9SPHN|nr:amidohydrolase family protein [Sphingomonas crocodyli]RVT91011.1 amidohydrolase [Sphingomonas crocodyli]
MSETIVVKGGQIADGTGGALYEAGIAIREGRIAAIGKDLSGDQVLDARGQVVAPGFIDMHTHYDAQLFWDPDCTPSSWQGVTSVIIGNCGFALAPCRPENRETLIQMLVELEDMPAKVLNAGIQWSFTDFAGYMASVEALRPTLNIAAYVGHSPVRVDVMGADAYDRAATDEEIARMAAIVGQAMDAGAIGFASSSAPTGRRSATGKADARELLALGRAMAKDGRGVMAMVPGGQHLSREAMYDMQAEIGRPFTWTALMQTADGGHRASAALHAERYAKGARVHPQVSCRPIVSMTTLRTAFAMRAASMLALEGKSDAERIAAFRDPAWRATVKTELANYAFTISWDRWTISESPTSPELEGMTVEALAKRLGVDGLDAAIDLALADGLATRFTVVQVNYEEDEVAKLLRIDGAVLGLADSGAHPDQICDAILPTDLLGKWVRDKKVLPIETAVRKLTGELADLFGLDRGYLKVGAPADITVFDPATIGPGPVRRVYDQPAGGERLIADRATGLTHMLVNGVPIRRDGAALARGAAGGPGMMLRG